MASAAVKYRSLKWIAEIWDVPMFKNGQSLGNGVDPPSHAAALREPLPCRSQPARALTLRPIDGQRVACAAARRNSGMRPSVQPHAPSPVKG